MKLKAFQRAKQSCTVAASGRKYKTPQRLGRPLSSGMPLDPFEPITKLATWSNRSRLAWPSGRRRNMRRSTSARAKVRSANKKRQLARHRTLPFYSSQASSHLRARPAQRQLEGSQAQKLRDGELPTIRSDFLQETSTN